MPEDLTQSLAAAESSFLTATVSVNLAAREVTVPQRVLNHSDDLTKLIWSESAGAADYGHLSTLSLLKYIGGRLAAPAPGEQAGNPLQPLVDASEATTSSRAKKAAVKLCPAQESLEFGYDFGLKRSRTAAAAVAGGGSQSARTSPSASPRGHHRQRSKDEGRRGEPRADASAKKPPASVVLPETTSEKEDDDNRRRRPATTTESRPQYTITVETLAFVKQRMPLLAAMMHLLCPSPSPPAATASSGRAAATAGGGGGGEGEEESGDELEPPRERGREKEKEREGDEGGRPPPPPAPARRNLLKSLRGDRTVAATAAASVAPPVSARGRRSSITSYDLLPQQPWQRQFEDVLIHFVDFPVLRNYLLTRLMNFESVLPWDPPAPPDDAAGRPPESGKRRPRASLHGLRQIALLPAASPELGDACCHIVRKLLEGGMANEAVRFLSSEPALAHADRVGFAADLALASAFVKSYLEVVSLGQGGEGVREKTAAASVVADPVSLLSRLSDPELAARLALASLRSWPAGVCAAMLTRCLHHLRPSSPLLPALSEKLHRMEVYEKVMETCESPLRGGGGGGGFGGGARRGGGAKSPWGSWSELAADSESKPGYVLQILLESKAFSLAHRWASSHSLSPDITQVYHRTYFNILYTYTCCCIWPLSDLSAAN